MLLNFFTILIIFILTLFLFLIVHLIMYSSGIETLSQSECAWNIERYDPRRSTRQCVRQTLVLPDFYYLSLQKIYCFYKLLFSKSCWLIMSSLLSYLIWNFRAHTNALFVPWSSLFIIPYHNFISTSFTSL